jgi:hypothetical protein
MGRFHRQESRIVNRKLRVPLKKRAMYKIVQKQNNLVVHALCETLERAKYWIEVKAPVYVERGYFSDKSLTQDSFEIKHEPRA